MKKQTINLISLIGEVKFFSFKLKDIDAHVAKVIQIDYSSGMILLVNSKAEATWWHLSDIKKIDQLKPEYNKEVFDGL